MSKIKEWTAKVHLGILDLTTIILLILILVLGYYEGYFLTKISFMVYGEEPTIIDYVASYAPIVIGCLLTMGVPPYIKMCKSEVSSGGINISPMEVILLFVMLIGAAVMYGSVFYKSMEALKIAKNMGKLTEHAYNLRVSSFTFTIGANLFIDLLLGLWTIYEIESHNGSIRTIKTGKYRKALISKNKKKKADEEEEKKKADEEEKKYQEAIEDLKKKTDEQKELNLPIVVKT